MVCMAATAADLVSQLCLMVFHQLLRTRLDSVGDGATSALGVG